MGEEDEKRNLGIRCHLHREGTCSQIILEVLVILGSLSDPNFVFESSSQ